MDNYLVSYEYKVSYGTLIMTKTETEVLSYNELKELPKVKGNKEGYFKIIFCKKL